MISLLDTIQKAVKSSKQIDLRNGLQFRHVCCGPSKINQKPNLLWKCYCSWLHHSKTLWQRRSHNILKVELQNPIENNRLCASNFSQHHWSSQLPKNSTKEVFNSRKKISCCSCQSRCFLDISRCLYFRKLLPVLFTERKYNASTKFACGLYLLST